MIRAHAIALLMVALLACLHCGAVSIDSGNIKVEAITGDDSREYETDLFGGIKQRLMLTQSSKVKIEAKVTKVVGRSTSVSAVSNQSL